METQEILEGNRLIAEFMGMPITNVDVEYDTLWVSTDLHNGGAIVEETNACFHHSWDWLMPCVEKIAAIPKIETVKPNYWYGYEISSGHCWFYRENALYDKKEISNTERSTTIEATWQSVIGFIKWYNDNSPSRPA
jgi:hypothetical protein